MTPVLAIVRLVIKEIFRKKDFYVALILIGVILFYAQGLQFYNVQNISRYLMEIGLALIFLFSVILTVALASRQYPSEIQNRTGPLMLAKPISRTQFVLGKFTGSFLAGASCFGVFYALFIFIVWSKAGALDWPLAIQAFYLFVLNLLVLSAMASAFSYSMTVSANVTVSLVLYILINTYGAGLRQSASGFTPSLKMLCEFLYFVWPHFEFFDLRHRFIHEWSALPASLVGVITLYALVYTAVFLAWACSALRKRAL